MLWMETATADLEEARRPFDLSAGPLFRVAVRVHRAANHEHFAKPAFLRSVDGRYHDLAILFNRLSNFSRIINVEEMKMSAMNDPLGGKSIAASFTAKTFIYTADEKGDAQKKAGAAKPAVGAAGKARTLKKKSEAGLSE